MDILGAILTKYGPPILLFGLAIAAFAYLLSIGKKYLGIVLGIVLGLASIIWIAR